MEKKIKGGLSHARLFPAEQKTSSSGKCVAFRGHRPPVGATVYTAIFSRCNERLVISLFDIAHV